MTSERAIPRLCAGFAVIWGLFAANPYGDVFGRIPGLYEPMLSLIPSQVVWGVMILSAGLMSEVAAHRDEIAKACLIIAIPFFAFSTLYLMADLGSPAWALWAWLGGYNFAIFWGRRDECFKRSRRV